MQTENQQSRERVAPAPYSIRTARPRVWPNATPRAAESCPITCVAPLRGSRTPPPSVAVAVACCWYAWNKPIVWHDVDDHPYYLQEHRVPWSRWSVAAAGLAVVLCVPLLPRVRGHRRWTAVATAVVATVVLAYWTAFLLRWR